VQSGASSGDLDQLGRAQRAAEQPAGIRHGVQHAHDRRLQRHTNLLSTAERYSTCPSCGKCLGVASACRLDGNRESFGHHTG
jgi:hypothetical protein